MSIVYHDGLLHTNSAYFSSASVVATNDNVLSKLQDIENIKADYEGAINYARSKEIAFYQTFFSGVTEYEVFITKLRELFNKADQAGEKIEQLANMNLKANIQTKKGAEEQVRYQIRIDSTALKQLPDIPTSIINGKIGEGVYLSLSKNSEIKAAKRVVNKISNTKFDIESSNPIAIKQWFEQQLLNEGGTLADGIVISKSEPQGDVVEVDTKQTYFKIGQFPFMWSKKEIAENRAKGDKEFEELFEQAKDVVYNFLKGKLQVEDDGGLLSGAFEASWSAANAKLGDFFFEGDNLIKAVLGNIGEFQLLLWTNYAAMAMKTYTPELGKIIGDEAKDGRGQNRSDYQLMVSIGADIGEVSEETIGIQSKNIDEKRYRKIEVNSDLGLIAPNLGSNLTTSIANYQFNASIASKVGDMHEVLETYINNYIWRNLNFNVNEGLNPQHTNTFYWLGGNKIIPVSEIISKLYNPKDPTNSTNQNMQKPTTEFNLEPGKTTDEQFEEGEPPLFVTYWKKFSYGWEPQPDNTTAYQLFLTGIRIKSVLNLASFIEVSGGSGRFEIFTK